MTLPGVIKPDVRFIQIDEEGYFKMDELRVADAEIGRVWLASLSMDERGIPWVRIDGTPILVEAFDEPYIALDIEKSAGGSWQITLPYGHREIADTTTFTLDEWDRFHGRTSRGVPFVLARAAQARLFDLVDEYDDDSVTIEGRRYEIRPWLEENPDVNRGDFWTNIYRTEEPRCELNAPAQGLVSLVPRLKLQRMRVLVPGAGTGNDAAWFAEHGHLVTAVDFSDEAVARAKLKYSHLPNLKFVQADIFEFAAKNPGAFDLVFEHTLYCAINPARRNELVQAWRRLLSENGLLTGVFFALDKQKGPPYGGSEWELRARLKGFRHLYWTRLRDSLPRRLGHELFIHAEKLAAF